MSNWIMIVAGGILQQPAVRAAHELGYKVLVTDRDPNCACASLADHFVEMDIFDTRAHCELAQSLRPAAVFTAGADPIVTVASANQWARTLGPLPVEIAQTCAHKFKTREALDLYDVPQPRRAINAHLLTNAVQLGLDCECEYIIVKATGSSGSRGHMRLKVDGLTERELGWARERAMQYSRGVPIVEELLTGVELSVETLWYDGTMIPLNAVERPFMNHPQYAIELGHYNPWVASPEDYDAVWHVAELAGQAVGMGAQRGGHIFKIDVMFTDDGPKVLECTTRLSGGFDSGWTTPLAHGADYTKGALLLALGEPLHVAMPYFAKRWAKHAACMAAFGPAEGGIIKEIKGLERARSLAGDVILRFDVGDELPPLEDCGSRVAFCIADSHTSIIGASFKAKEAIEFIEVVCE